MLDLNLGLVLIISLLGYAYFYLIGDTILYLTKQPFREYFAPIIGYVFFSYLFFLLFFITNNFIPILSVSLLLLGGCFLLRRRLKIPFPDLPYATLLGSLGIAAYVLYVLHPQISGQNFGYYGCLVDHVKASFTSSIAQNGLPLVNPYCAFPEHSFYYFLYYVPLAALKIIFNSTSYEVELAGGMLTCLLGIPLIIGCVCLLKEKKCSWFEVFICILFIVMQRKFSLPFIHHEKTVFSALFVIRWTPNTFLAASLLTFSLFWIYRKKFSSPVIPAICLACVLGLSPYIFLVSFWGIALFCLYELYISKQKKALLFQMIKMGTLTALFALPFLYIQSNAYGDHMPIEWKIYSFSKWKSPLLKILGFYTIFLITQVPVIYLINLFSFSRKKLKKYAIFYCSIFVSLFICCFLKSTVMWNDLGRRAVFVAIELMTIFAIYYFLCYKRKIIKGGFLIFCIICCYAPVPRFEKVKKYWEPLSSETIAAIQHYVKPEDRYLNNGNRELKLRGGWTGKVNLEFGLLLERKSCLLSPETVGAYCGEEMRRYLPISDRIFTKNFNQTDIDKMRAIKCNKFIFHKTDFNYDKDELLKAFGLKKIYENKQIKIWE